MYLVPLPHKKKRKYAVLIVFIASKYLTMEWNPAESRIKAENIYFFMPYACAIVYEKIEGAICDLPAD